PDNAIAELNENNNQASITLTNTPADTADLSVTSSDIAFSNSSPLPGDSVQVTATIHNVGNQASGNFNVQFSNGDPFAVTNRIFATVAVNSIAANGIVQVSVSFTISRGTHTIFVVADSDKTVPESNEANNIASKSITTTALPDLLADPIFLTVDH